MQAYRVIKTYAACKYCGEGQLWSIIDARGVTIGMDFTDKCDAQELAVLLNEAYRLGRQKEKANGRSQIGTRIASSIAKSKIQTRQSDRRTGRHASDQTRRLEKGNRK